MGNTHILNEQKSSFLPLMNCIMAWPHCSSLQSLKVAWIGSRKTGRKVGRGTQLRLEWEFLAVPKRIPPAVKALHKLKLGLLQLLNLGGGVGEVGIKYQCMPFTQKNMSWCSSDHREQKSAVCVLSKLLNQKVY